MKIIGLCVGFCAAMLVAVFAIEGIATRRARGQAESFADKLTPAIANWTEHGVPPTQRIVSLFIDDVLDDDAPAGSGDSWSDVARVATKRLWRHRSVPPDFGVQAPGLVMDWRTETLLWASDREQQYDAITTAIAEAHRKGVRVQIVARGRGAANVLTALRRNNNFPPDRILILGRPPQDGDEKLSAHAAFVYQTPGGSELAYTDDGTAFVREGGSGIFEQFQRAAKSVESDIPFKEGWDADPPSDAPTTHVTYDENKSLTADVRFPEEDVTLIPKLSNDWVKIYVNHGRRWYIKIKGNESFSEIFQGMPLSPLAPLPDSYVNMGVSEKAIDVNWSTGAWLWLFGGEKKSKNLNKAGAYLLITRQTAAERSRCLGPVLWWGFTQEKAQNLCDRYTRTGEQ